MASDRLVCAPFSCKPVSTGSSPPARRTPFATPPLRLRSACRPDHRLGKFHKLIQTSQPAHRAHLPLAAAAAAALRVV